MQKWIEREGVRIAYDVLPGEKDLTVILLHGYGLHRGMWEAQVEFLKGLCYPLINIDVRGHGASRPADAFSVVLAAADIQAIIEMEKPVRYALCGLSMGALIAQEYAFAHGGAAGYMLTGGTPIFMPYAAWEKILLKWSGPMLRLYTWRGLVKAMAKVSAETQGARDSLIRMFDELTREEFLVSWRGFCTCLHEEDFQFDAPVLVIAGEHDTRGTIRKHLPDWPIYHPGSDVRVLKGAGHVANLDVPEEFNALLKSFLDKL